MTIEHDLDRSSRRRPRAESIREPGSPDLLQSYRYRARPRPRSCNGGSDKTKTSTSTSRTSGLHPEHLVNVDVLDPLRQAKQSSTTRTGGLPSPPLETLDGHHLITLILGVDRLELCDFRPLLARLGLIPHDIQRLGILGVMDNSLGR